EAEPWREVLSRVGQGLPIVAYSDVDSEVASQAYAVLRESGIEPLRQFVAVNPEVDRLRVILHVVQRQLIEGQCAARSCGKDREGAEDRRAGFAARAARGVAGHASAEPEVVFASRPRQRVRELRLMAEDVGGARLSDGERHGPAARVSG